MQSNCVSLGILCTGRHVRHRKTKSLISSASTTHLHKSRTTNTMSLDLLVNTDELMNGQVYFLTNHTCRICLHPDDKKTGHIKIVSFPLLSKDLGGPMSIRKGNANKSPVLKRSVTHRPAPVTRHLYPKSWSPTSHV